MAYLAWFADVDHKKKKARKKARKAKKAPALFK
jgi:hypothetical protein